MVHDGDSLRVRAATFYNAEHCLAILTERDGISREAAADHLREKVIT